MGDLYEVFRGIHKAQLVAAHVRRHGGELLPAGARNENTAARYGVCGLDGHWRAGLRDRRHHLVQRAGNGGTSDLCRSAACWHHWTEDHVGLIHTIILPRPARRCAAAGPERTARCADRR